MAKDSDYKRLIGTARWQRLRHAVLNAQPLCERCKAEGLVTAATEVHHRRPVEYGTNFDEKRRLMYDTDNLQALCHTCHVEVHKEMGRSGKAAVRRRNDAQVQSVIVNFFNDS